MENFQNILIFIAGFAVISLASKQIGQFFTRAHLPLISGFLCTGILAGPFVLNLIPVEAVENLRFVDEISLAFIAFAAGSELYLRELKDRFKSITWVTIGLVVVTFHLGSITLFFLSDYIPFMKGMPVTSRVAVSILAGAILVARSPSSAIAIINELRARGPFTRTALGVTVVMDAVVIILFAINSSFADTLLTSLTLDIGFILFLLAELLISLGVGYALGKILQFIISRHINDLIKTALVLLVGYGVFVLAETIRQTSHQYLPVEIFLEPLLICMIGGFVVTNYGLHRDEFLKTLNDVGPPIYIIFFTLTGVSLALDILVKTWPITLALFFVRLGAIFIGSFSGGTLAKDPVKYNLLGWMSYITQAGVGLGLAKNVAVEFPEWGTAFATIIISVIVLNQIVGPPFFKWAIKWVGEAHLRAEVPKFDGVRDALIFGLEGQSLALARQLRSHGWQVKIASRGATEEDIAKSDGVIHRIPNLSLETLHQLQTERFEAVVMMLSDEENYHVCELIYEHFGTENLVVRLNNPADCERFHELGALIVDPSTAIVSLLDHMVRSPVATSLLLGMEVDQDIVDIELRNPNLDGITLRDLRLPLDTLIQSIHRNGHMIISHGYTHLELGDRVTVVGSVESLEEVMLHFEA